MPKESNIQKAITNRKEVWEYIKINFPELVEPLKNREYGKAQVWIEIKGS